MVKRGVWLYVSFDEGKLEREVADKPARLELVKTVKPDRDRPWQTVTVFSFLEIRELDNERYAFLQVKHVPAVKIEASVIGEKVHRSVKRLRENRDAWANNFQLTIDKGERTAKFGPKGWIMVQPDECKGRGIGSYAFGKVIAWGKEHYPDYSPLPLALSPRDATDPHDPENRDRRNRFYERFGFEMRYDDPGTKDSGKAVAGRLSLLSVPDPAGKLEVLCVEDTLRELLTRQEEIERNSERLEHLNRDLRERIRVYESSAAWRNKIIALLLTVLVAAFLVWRYGYIQK